MATYNFLFKKIDDKEIKIKGLGKVAVSRFRRLGVETIYDLLYFFPRAYSNVFFNSFNRLYKKNYIKLMFT